MEPNGVGARKPESLRPAVEAAPAESPGPAPAADIAVEAETHPGREEQVVPMSPIRRRIADRLVEAQRTAALLTTFNQADMSAVISLRKQHEKTFQARHGVKLGFMSFFVKTSIEALKQTPQINAEV